MKTEKSLADLTRQNVETIARMEASSEKSRTYGEKVSDLIALGIGSWTFLITQTVLLIIWMGLNLLQWVKHWDPYPFVFLNLALSFQAAFAGPIIMMSQNRQSRLIEKRNQLDLQINLLSEQENTEMLQLLRLLCQKSGITANQLQASDVLSQTTKPDALVDQIEKINKSR